MEIQMLAKIKTVLSSVWSDVKDTYSRIKIYLLAGLALLVYLKFNQIKSYIQTYLLNKQMNKSNQENTTLNAQETTDETKADSLVQQANSLPSTEAPVGEDWFKKEK